MTKRQVLLIKETVGEFAILDFRFVGFIDKLLTNRQTLVHYRL